MLACARIGAAAQRRVRRLLAAGARRPHQRRRGQGADHRRRRLPPRRGRSRSSRPPTWRVADDADDRARRRRASAAATTSTMVDGPRPLVPRPRWPTADADCPAEPMDSRAPAVPALHVGHHRQAQGHHAHDRRLPHPGRVHPQVRVRPPPRRPTCTGAPPTSAGSPATATSSTARWPTAPRSVMYEGVPELPRQRPVLGDRREVRRHDPLHRADRHPHVHEVGRRRSRPSTTCRSLRLLGIGRRADQPRGVDVVPRAHRRRALPDRRHVVADRDRRAS